MKYKFSSSEASLLANELIYLNSIGRGLGYTDENLKMIMIINL